MARARYSALVTNGIIFIKDDFDHANPTMSVTNDAEEVTRELVRDFGNLPIVARDTVGTFSQFCHIDGEFRRFGPDWASLEEALDNVSNDCNPVRYEKTA